MEIGAICEALETSALSKAILGPTWLWPALASVHLMAMALLVASITAFDLRLLGVIMRDQPVSQVARRLVPATWSGFAVMILTGVLMFLPVANGKYCPNASFQLKLVLLALAGVNMTYFHLTVFRNVDTWDRGETPMAAKVVGTFSALLWMGVVAAGRFIGFVG